MLPEQRGDAKLRIGLVDYSDPAHVLVVIYRSLASAALVDAIGARAENGACRFSVVIPTPVDGLSPGRRQAKWWTTEGQASLALALALIEEATEEPVDGWASTNPSPFDAVQETTRSGRYDEIIISAPSQPLLRRLHFDLASNLTKLGLPVTVVPSCRFDRAGDRHRVRRHLV